MQCGPWPSVQMGRHSRVVVMIEACVYGMCVLDKPSKRFTDTAAGYEQCPSMLMGQRWPAGVVIRAYAYGMWTLGSFSRRSTSTAVGYGLSPFILMEEQ